MAESGQAIETSLAQMLDLFKRRNQKEIQADLAAKQEASRLRGLLAPQGGV
jgi:hypothetical protein